VSELFVPVGIIALLVIVNGLFVAAEFSIVAAPRASVEHLASQGSRLAGRVLRILENPRLQDRYIATTQIGISAASVGLGMYGEHWLADRIAGGLDPLGASRWIAAHTLAGIIAVAILTYIHIVVGEMVPKALALQSAHRTALYTSPFIELVEKVVLPLVVPLNAFANGLLKLFGVKRRGETRASAITLPKSCSTSFRRARKAGCCAARQARYFATSSSSAIVRPAKPWCRACC
jgi:CBS domain containing-hemolysin-like protein